MRRAAFAILALTLVAAACGDDDGGVPFTTSSDATTSSEATSSTTAAPTSTTTTTTPPTTAPSTTSVPMAYPVDPDHLFPSVFPGVDNGAHGSGCVTPGFDELPDGVWFGFAEGVGSAITFDLACFFTGPAACDAQMEDGEAATVNDCLDFWIRNNVATTFTVPVAPTARAWYIDAFAPPEDMTMEIDLSSWPTSASIQTCPGDHCAVWLYVNGGEATAIAEQYLP